jgi:hypothetical protein
MPIAANHDLGPSLKSAFEDTVVRLVVFDCVNRFLGLNEPGVLSDACDGLSCSRGRPLKLGKQNPFDLLEDRRGDEEQDGLASSEVPPKLSAEI